MRTSRKNQVEEQRNALLAAKDPEEWISTVQACDEYGISRTSLHNALVSGEIPFNKVIAHGREVRRITRRSIASWLGLSIYTQTLPRSIGDLRIESREEPSLQEPSRESEPVPAHLQEDGKRHYKFGWLIVDFIDKLGLSFGQGNVVKYIARPPKPNENLDEQAARIQDIKKAINYAKRELEIAEGAYQSTLALLEKGD